MTETWIKYEDQAKRIQIPSYTHYFNYRNTGKGGGVSIFVHNDLRHNLVEERFEEGNHYLWIHVAKYSLNIGAIYKPGRTSTTKFLDTYSIQLAKFHRAVIFGDFNFDILKPDLNVRKYKYAYKVNGFQILNKVSKNFSTRETASTKTILDHISTNLKNHNFHFAVVESAMSDHKHIYFEIQNYNSPPPIKIKYRKINYKKLYETYEETTGITKNTQYDTLEEKLKNCIAKSRVTNYKLLNTPKDDWINKEIIHGLIRRNELWQKFKKKQIR
jgi:hypothetical protein